MNIIEKLILKVIQNKVTKWFALERSLTSLDNVYKSVEKSPEKSWPDPDKFLSGRENPFSMRNIRIVGNSLRSSVDEEIKSIKSIQENPKLGRLSIEDYELKEFEEFAKLKGIGAIGYTKLPSNLIFKDRAVLYDTAIVLIMEMDSIAIGNAPSEETFRMVMSTYDKLGKTTNLLTDKLRKMGYQSQASHPLGGLVLYPPYLLILIIYLFQKVMSIHGLRNSVINVVGALENVHQMLFLNSLLSINRGGKPIL